MEEGAAEMDSHELSTFPQRRKSYGDAVIGADPSAAGLSETENVEIIDPEAIMAAKSDPVNNGSGPSGTALHEPQAVPLLPAVEVTLSQVSPPLCGALNI